MNRRNFFAVAVGALGTPLLSRSSGDLKDKPNILFVTTDDHAQWAVGAYGNSEVHTPVMDRLASEGMRFNQAFTCPVCSPSRAMVMTGLYNHQVGVEDWISPAQAAGIPKHVPTLGEELKRAGYRTALIGKWHLGHSRVEQHPTSRGFDYFMGMLEGGREASMMNPTLVENGRTFEFEGGLTDVLADHAIRFLRTYREQPFALFFHTRRPHAPYVPVPDEDWEPYRGKSLTVPHVEGYPEEKLQEIMGQYYASITSVDRNLGRILDELSQQAILDDTLVIFTGDNGYNIGQHGHWHKGNGSQLVTGKTRPNMWDTSCRVPLIVRYPGWIRAGSTCEEQVSSLDFFPTLLEVVHSTRRPGLVLEGMNFLPLLKGEKTTWREDLFLVYNMHHYMTARMRLLRTRDWKLIHHYEKGNGHELYDLRNDGEETRNLYGVSRVRGIQEEMERRLVLFEKRTGAYREPS